MWRAGAQLGMIARALARHPVPPPGFSDGLRTDARLYPSWVRALQTQPSGALFTGACALRAWSLVAERRRDDATRRSEGTRHVAVVRSSL